MDWNYTFVISNHSYLYLTTNKSCTLYSTETTRLFLFILLDVQTVITHGISVQYAYHMSTINTSEDLLCDRTFH